MGDEVGRERDCSGRGSRAMLCAQSGFVFMNSPDLQLYEVRIYSRTYFGIVFLGLCDIFNSTAVPLNTYYPPHL